MSKLNEKVQVLLSKEDLEVLNRLILRDAYTEGIRPVPLSTYVRLIIKNHIEDNIHLLEEQISFASNKVKEIKETKNK